MRWPWYWDMDVWVALINVVAIIAATIGVWRANVRADRANVLTKTSLALALEQFRFQQLIALRPLRVELELTVDSLITGSVLIFQCRNTGGYPALGLRIYAQEQLGDTEIYPDFEYLQPLEDLEDPRLNPETEREYTFNLVNWSSEFEDWDLYPTAEQCIDVIPNPTEIGMDWTDGIGTHITHFHLKFCRTPGIGLMDDDDGFLYVELMKVTENNGDEEL